MGPISVRVASFQLPDAGAFASDASDDATILMPAWAPGRRGPLPRGSSRLDVEAAFVGWKVASEEAFEGTDLPRLLRNVDTRVYRQHRAPLSNHRNRH